MDFLKETLNSHTGHKPNQTTPETEHKPEQHQTHTKPHKQPSTSELMASAKVVADAAKAKLGQTTGEELDNKKVAAAAGDLLSGVKHYAKLEDNVGLGKYVDKAETYLHKYDTSSHSGGTTVNTVSAGAEEGEKKKEGQHGPGDYFKMAEGFLKK